MAKNSKVTMTIITYYPFRQIRFRRKTNKTDALGHRFYEKAYAEYKD